MISYSSDPQIACLQDLSLWQGNTQIFHRLNWSLTPYKWTCLLGQSGIGKSSLLRLLAGLNSKDTTIQGQIYRQKQLSYLGQNDALLPWLSVFDNACLSAQIGPYTQAEKKILKQRALDLLQKVGLGETLALYPKALSGGMRQRLALVRALIEDKPLMLMDEPFARLDAITRYQLQNLAAELLKGKTVLLVSHDPQEALRLADRIDLISGRPARLETVASFATSGPRDLANPELIHLEKQLYQILSDHYQ